LTVGVSNPAAVLIGAIALTVAQGVAQEPLSQDDLLRADAIVREAFGFLYTLPSDAAAASLGSWVLDSAATTPASEPGGRWRIVVTKLTDTGQDLTLEEMVGEPGTSPAELAAAMAAMQRLEAKISRAEAEASLEIAITLNAPETSVRDVSDAAQRSRGVVPNAQVAERVAGHWKRVDDRELEISYERWMPATLLVRFGNAAPMQAAGAIRTVVITAQGSEEILERVVKETRWQALASLIK